MGGETIGQRFRSLITVPFEMREKCVFCAMGEVYRPTLEEQQKRVAKDPTNVRFLCSNRGQFDSLTHV